MSEWESVILNDIVSILGDGLHGTPVFDEFGKYFFINGNNLINGKILIKKDTRRTSKKEYEKYKKNLNGSTILLSINGTLGNVATYQGEPCILGKSACYFNVKENVERDFIKYIIIDNSFQNYIHKVADGTTIKNLSLKTLRNYSFPLPPLPTQKAIAHILGTLDDKIELLRQMNETLEAMARALFQSWFVDFDPVRKKADGITTGLPKEIEDLFPSEFEDSELGEIPIGWKVGKLGDEVESVSITHKFPKGKAIFLNTGDILEGQFLHSKSTDSSLFPGQAKKTISNGDILFSEIRPQNKRYAYVDFEADDYVVSTKLMVLRNLYGKSNIPLYYFLKSDQILGELQIQAESRSGTFPQITFDNIKVIKRVIPSDKISDIYESMLKSNFILIRENQKIITQLTTLRDSLLPKLISGELDLSDKMISAILEPAK